MNHGPRELIEQLRQQGGAIVSTGDCSHLEIAQAQACGRMAIDERGFGYVRRPAEWLRRTKALGEVIAAAQAALAELNDGQHTLLCEHLRTAIANAQGKQLAEPAGEAGT